MFIFKSSPNVYLVPKHVKQGIFIPGLATLKLFAHDTSSGRCGQAYFSCLGPTATYSQEQGIINFVQLSHWENHMIKTIM